jgi:hypothetical protein
MQTNNTIKYLFIAKESKSIKKVQENSSYFIVKAVVIAIQFQPITLVT